MLSPYPYSINEQQNHFSWDLQEGQKVSRVSFHLPSLELEVIYAICYIHINMSKGLEYLTISQIASINVYKEWLLS